MLAEGGEEIKPLDGARLYYDGNDQYTGCYNLKWKDSEERKEHFLRREHPLCQKLIKRCQIRTLPVVEVLFDYSNSGRKISYLDVTPCKTGWLTINKLSNESFETDEHLLISVLGDDKTELPEDMINRIMELPAICIDNKDIDVPTQLYGLLDQVKEKKLKDIDEQNKKYFLEECEKLDAWSEDRKSALQQDLKDMDRHIKEKNREVSLSASDCSLEELVEKKAEVQRLKKIRERKRRELFEEEDKIELENERLQDEMRRRMRGKTTIENIFTIRFGIV